MLFDLDILFSYSLDLFCDILLDLLLIRFFLAALLKNYFNVLILKDKWCFMLWYLLVVLRCCFICIFVVIFASIVIYINCLGNL